MLEARCEIVMSASCHPFPPPGCRHILEHEERPSVLSFQFPPFRTPTPAHMQPPPCAIQPVAAFTDSPLPLFMRTSLRFLSSRPANTG